MNPNLIIITCHDVGCHFGCLGDANVKTPNVDVIASEGVVFENYFATCPLCSPSRSSFITGLYPHANGMNGLTHRGFCINNNEKVLAEYFNEAGYFTSLIGLQHESENLTRLKYQQFESPYDNYRNFAELVAPRAVDFITNYDRKQPFLLSVGFWEAHRPFDESLSGFAPYPEDLKLFPYMWDSPGYREELSRFYRMIARIDDAVGQIDQAIRNKGIYDDTILVFTADHGIAFPRAKSTLYDPGTGIIFAMRYPGIVPAGNRISAIASNVDFLPSIALFCGLKLSDRIQGMSFTGLLLDKNRSYRDAVFMEKTYHGNEYDPMRSIRTNDFKYIRNFTDGYLYQLPLDIRNGLIGKEAEDRRSKPRPERELYDLRNDPDERHNLINDPQYLTLSKDLDTRLLEWMRNTSDPLLAETIIPWPDKDNEYYPNNKWQNPIVSGGDC